MGSKCQDRLHSSSCGTVHEKRNHHRKDVSFEGGFTQRSKLRHADAYILHKPGRTRSQPEAASRTGKGEVLAFETSGSRPGKTGAKDCRLRLLARRAASALPFPLFPCLSVDTEIPIRSAGRRWDRGWPPDSQDKSRRTSPRRRRWRTQSTPTDKTRSRESKARKCAPGLIW